MGRSEKLEELRQKLKNFRAHVTQLPKPKMAAVLKKRVGPRPPPICPMKGAMKKVRRSKCQICGLRAECVCPTRREIFQ